MKKTPHVHAALIHAWADGAQVELWLIGLATYPPKGYWALEKSPCWFTESKYRIKPNTEGT